MEVTRDEQDNVPKKMEVSENISFLSFAAERQKEIIAMTNSISNPTTTKLIFQKLPPQMRRRVMSHNSKRLPIRLREGHMNQLTKSGLPPCNKRPSRCYRRRPTNLFLEYKRRQKTKKWLETHIWHAKRFHMSDKWGFRLPEAPCDKSLRASFRASLSHCLLQDISYNFCIQLTGKEKYLLSKLSCITNTDFGLTFASKAFLSGTREGNVEIIYDEFPHNAIGTVKFLWCPNIEEDLRKLWIFGHPAYYDEVLNLFIKLFSLKHLDRKNGAKCETELDSLNYFNDIGVNLTIIEDLNRFTLTGPLSNAVLKESLKEISIPSNQCMTENWAQSFFKNSNETDISQKQACAWNSIKQICLPSDLSPHLVLGLNIQDPRSLKDNKRSKALPGNNSVVDLKLFTNDVCHSPLWNVDIRQSIKKNMISNGELCKLRNKHNLVPGEIGVLGKYLQPIPIILIQKSGVRSDKLGYGSGWDIIIPPNFAMPLWISFIMHGARVGGLRETRNMCFESQTYYMLPDTVAGKTEELQIYRDLRNKYFKLPPAKRINYVKIGINSPFKCHWQLLINEWTARKYENFKVLREVRVKEEIQAYLEGKLPSITVSPDLNIIIPVSLNMIKKGICKDFAIICFPDANDMKIYRNNDFCKMHMENKHVDENEDKRRHERLIHATQLKQLRRKRLLARKKYQLTAKQPELLEKLNSESLVKEHLTKIQQLWLPENILTVRYQCSREVMGYVTNGGFSFVEHMGMGIGFVTLKSLVDLRSKFNKNIVILRNTTSRKYSFASINIIK